MAGNNRSGTGTPRNETGVQNREGCLLLDPLTEREEDVISWVAKGLTNKQVAQELHISPATVETHLHNIYSKLGVSNRVQATIVAYQIGIVAP